MTNLSNKLMAITLSNGLQFALTMLVVLGIIIVGVIILVFILSLFIGARFARENKQNKKTMKLEDKEKLFKEYADKNYTPEQKATQTKAMEEGARIKEEKPVINGFDAVAAEEEALALYGEGSTSGAKYVSAGEKPSTSSNTNNAFVLLNDDGGQSNAKPLIVSKGNDVDKVKKIAEILEFYEDVLDFEEEEEEVNQGLAEFTSLPTIEEEPENNNLVSSLPELDETPLPQIVENDNKNVENDKINGIINDIPMSDAAKNAITSNTSTNNNSEKLIIIERPVFIDAYGRQINNFTPQAMPVEEVKKVIPKMEYLPYKNAIIKTLEDAEAEHRQIVRDIEELTQYVINIEDKKEREMAIRELADYKDAESKIRMLIEAGRADLDETRVNKAEINSQLVIIERERELMGADNSDLARKNALLEDEVASLNELIADLKEEAKNGNANVDVDALEKAIKDAENRAEEIRKYAAIEIERLENENDKLRAGAGANAVDAIEIERLKTKLAELELANERLKANQNIGSTSDAEVEALKNEIARLNDANENLKANASEATVSTVENDALKGQIEELKLVIERLNKDLAAASSVVPQDAELEKLRNQLVAEAEKAEKLAQRADEAERAAELARAEIILLQKQTDTYVINKFGAYTEEELEEKIRILEARKRANDKEKKSISKEYVPLDRIERTYESDMQKLRRKEAIVAKQGVFLHGVNNVDAIDEEKAKKFEEDTQLLDGLRSSVRHCEDVLAKNKDRLPILRSAYNVIVDNEKAIIADIEETKAALKELQDRKKSDEETGDVE
jgi:hypothetical protein